MTLLVVGVSHHSAPMAVLDEIALDPQHATGLLTDIAHSSNIAEALVVATCNRLEVYADVPRFHPALDDVAELLAKHTGRPRADLTSHLFVHYEDAAIAHLFKVASGLDSMVVGEQQILGQVRTALKSAQDAGSAGRVLNELVQSALRTGKKVHSHTDIDRAGASVVSVAVDEARAMLGSLNGRRALVIGAGSMSGLAVACLADEELESVVVANRTAEAAQRLAGLASGRAIGLDDLKPELADVDLIVSCTGAQGLVLKMSDLAERELAQPLVILDLALPHDTDPALADLPGVTRIDLAALANLPAAQASAKDVAAARQIVAEEVARATTHAAVARVEPIVVSLRAKASEVADAELNRLRLRLPHLSETVVTEIERTVRRVTATLMHTPTVRMKEFAADPAGVHYAEALQRLFDLEPEAVSALTKPLTGIEIEVAPPAGEDPPSDPDTTRPAP